MSFLDRFRHASPEAAPTPQPLSEDEAARFSPNPDRDAKAVESPTPNVPQEFSPATPERAMTEDFKQELGKMLSNLAFDASGEEAEALKRDINVLIGSKDHIAEETFDAIKARHDAIMSRAEAGSEDETTQIAA